MKNIAIRLRRGDSDIIILYKLKAIKVYSLLDKF